MKACSRPLTCTRRNGRATIFAATASNTLSLMQIVVPKVLFMPLSRAATFTPSPMTV